MRTRSEYALATYGLSTLFTLAAILLTADAEAVGTRRYVMNSLSSFEGGDLAGVSIGSDGTVSAGFNMSNTPIEEAGSVWASVVLDDGSVLLGTGGNGRIYQVRAGKVTVAAETGAMAVTSLVVASDGAIIAGTFPEGKIFKLTKAQLDGKKQTPWVTLKKGDTDVHVWGLAFDKKTNNVFAATGPEGKLFRINTAGAAEVHFDSEEPHLVGVAVGPDGTVYAGSNGEALLYKITGPGRAEVIYDFDGNDVKNIAFDSKGVMYVTSNSYYGGYGGIPSYNPGYDSGPGPSYGGGGGGNGLLVRFSAEGIVEEMYRNSSGYFAALEIDGNDVPFVGLGSEGQVYSVDNNHITRLEADTEERSISVLSLRGKEPYLVSTDPVVFHTIKGRGGADAVWTSKVLDAGLRAHYGKVEWTADGQLEIQTRTGNTKTPDNTWSKWSNSLLKASKVDSPASRYLQVRARWAKDPKAILHELKISFVTDNVRALITDVSGGTNASNTGGSIERSGDRPSVRGTTISLSWTVDNPDQDTVRYRLFYHAVGDTTWLAILEPSEELTSTYYSWDTSGLPEGRYVVRVDGTDELSNPPDKVTSHSNTSQPITVDNTAPVISNVTLTKGRLQGTATDTIGPISRVEFALVGKKTWYPVFPSDGIFDDATESWDVDVSKLIPEDKFLVVVRAYDDAGNMIERTVGK